MNELMIGAKYLAYAVPIATIIFGILLFFRIVFKNAVRNDDGKSNMAIYLFLVYLVCVGLITGVLNVGSWNVGSGISFDLIPFHDESLHMIVLNILLFMPMGIFFPMIVKRICWNYLKISVCGFSITLGIEFVQLFVGGRTFAVTDLIANSIGCFIGYFIFRMIQLWSKASQTKEAGMGTASLLLVVTALLWGTPYHRLCIGDIILATYRIPTWSGNTEHLYTLSGFHYTLLLIPLFTIPAFFLAYKNRGQLFARAGILSSIGVTILFLGIIIYQTLVRP